MTCDLSDGLRFIPLQDCIYEFLVLVLARHHHSLARQVTVTLRMIE